MPRLRFHPESGEELCIACHLCETVCPDDCIHIVSEKKPDGKGKRLVSFEINYERCCFCGLCVDPCPVDAIFPEDEVPEQWRDFIKINADYFKK